MAEVLCAECQVAAPRVLYRSDAGIIAVPAPMVRSGHLVVFSASHAASFGALAPAEAAAFMTLVASAARAAERASRVPHYYVLRIGDKAPHLHFHLVPRIESDEPLAPFVFSEGGWSGQARDGGAAGLDAFAEAFQEALR